MTCINCAAEGEGKYCSNCGQRLEVKRITFKEAWRDFWARIYGFDGMFPRTFKDLTIRPGFAAREFIRGNRVKYYGPVGYYFFMISLFLLLLSMIGTNYVDYLNAMQKSLPMADKDSQLRRDTTTMVVDNLKIFAFFIPVFVGLASRYVVFRKQGLNFIEHTIAPFYMLGHWYWIQMIESIIFYYAGWVTGTGIQFLLIGLYFGLGYTTFAPDQSKAKTFFKGIAVYAVGFLFMMITIILVSLVAFSVIAFISPEYFDSIRPSENP